MTTSAFSASSSRRQASSGAGARTVLARSSPEPYAPGRVLAGRFRIERVIGMGSMGMVLEACHLELDTRVAVKVILPQMQELPGMVALFAREAKAAVDIRSEHVAQVFDAGTDDELGPYIVMEYLEGRDLRAVLDREGHVPATRAIDYTLQACEALAAAHARGVIHRDIKPGNLFLTRQGELEIVKLLDFGVSKAALTGHLFGGELSGEVAADLMGTPLYMSPEQIRAPDRVDQRSDIWALGAVLYELVTGHSAFPGAANLPALLSRICEGPPRPLSEHCSGLSPLQGIIDQCLDKNPARRFQSVAELAYALFPLASARSQLHAHHAASILATPEALATPPSADMARQALPVDAIIAGSLSGSTEVPALRSPAASASQERRRSPRRTVGAGRWGPHCLLLIALLGHGALPGAGEGGERIASPAGDAQRSSESPVVGWSGTPPAAPGSRTVLVESRPSGALVSIEDQVIDRPPLSAVIPSGAVLLSLAKPGYSEARALLRRRPAKQQATPLAVSVALRPSAPASSVAPRARAARAAKPGNPAPAAAPGPGSRQNPPTRPPAGTRAAPKAPPTPERPRLRLVDDTARVRVASRL